MTELLVKYDPKEVLKNTRKILEDEGILPANCPKETCLSLEVIELISDTIYVNLDADPPQLPTKKSYLKYEIDPVCDKFCGICGNPNKGFKVAQNLKTGEVKNARSFWK